MARETHNPDRDGKGVSPSHIYTPCPDCGTTDPDDHAEGCRYAPDG